MKLVVTLVAVFGLAFVFERLRVPAGALLGAVVGAAVVNLMAAEGAWSLPGPARFVAFVLLGWGIGAGVSRESLTALSDNLLVLGGSVVAIVVSSALVGVALATWSDLSPTTSYLATSPGALSQMTVMADDLDADPLVVVAIHTTRVVVVLALAPIATRLLPT